MRRRVTTSVSVSMVIWKVETKMSILCIENHCGAYCRCILHSKGVKACVILYLKEDKLLQHESDLHNNIENNARPCSVVDNKQAAE